MTKCSHEVNLDPNPFFEILMSGKEIKIYEMKNLFVVHLKILYECLNFVFLSLTLRQNNHKITTNSGILQKV